MEKRETELDILRIAATLAVIWVHVGGMGTKVLPTSDPDCLWLIFLKSLMTWQVPVFVMISGRFFLDPQRQVSFGRILRAVGRLAGAFLLWNAVYQLFYLRTGGYDGLSRNAIISLAVAGPYHFWFLYRLAGLYLVVPFLRKIAEDRKLSAYFLGLFFAFSLLTKWGPALPFVGGTAAKMLQHTDMHFVLGFSGYYVLGYHLRVRPVSGKGEKWLYTLGAGLILLGAAANTWQSRRSGAYTEWFTAYTAPNTIAAAAAVFHFFANRIGKLPFSEAFARRTGGLARCCFGIYLLHVLAVESLELLGITPMLLHPLVSVPLLTALVFAVTAAAVALLRRIPYLGRRIL